MYMIYKIQYMMHTLEGMQALLSMSSLPWIGWTRARHSRRIFVICFYLFTYDTSKGKLMFSV